LIENGGAARNLESGPPKDHFNSNFRAKDLEGSWEPLVLVSCPKGQVEKYVNVEA
jgi:hypothetical protein